MSKVIFWGFSRAAQLEAYQRFPEPKVSYSAFSSDEDNIYGLDNFEQENFTLELAKLHQNIIIPTSLEIIFTDNFETYKMQFSRCTRGLGSCSKISRVKRHFWTLLQWYFFKYVNEKITFAIFAVPPHFGFDKLMSDFLGWMNVPVYYGYQTLFPNKYILYNQDFKRIPPTHPEPFSRQLKFPSVANEELSYMIGVTGAPPKARWIRWARKGIKSVFQQADKREASRNVIFGEFQFYKNLKEVGLWDNQRLEATLKGNPFIYFPLHLQPEMTTSMLGGKYVDQILAIEELSSILPKNFKIVVKENPKQSHKERNDSFFKRLKNLKNVVFVGKHLNSKWLIRKSQLVATITGTAGWEAIRFGKPVIVFGHAWYKDFYGVIKFRQNLDINSIIQHRPNPRQTQLDYSKFISQSWSGVIDAYYQEHSQNCEEQSVISLTKLFNYLNRLNNGAV